MKIFRKANTVGALMLAAGAVVTGASITSGAMAADDATPNDSGSAVVVGSAGVDGTGDAYQCSFDGIELPQLAPVAATETGPAVEADGAPIPVAGSEVIEASGVAGAGGTEEIEGTDAGRTPEGEATSFQVTVNDDGSTQRGPVSGPVADGEPIEIVGLGVDSEGNVVQADGGVIADGTIPDGAIEVSDVREGSEDECASLLAEFEDATVQSIGVDTTSGLAPTPAP